MNRRGIFQFFLFSVIGVLHQSISLVAFVLIARTDYADMGKHLAVCAAILASALLVWIWLRSIEKPMWIFLVPLALAVGFSAALRLVGFLLFPGLVKDLGAPFSDLWPVLVETGIVFVPFGIGTALILLLQRWMACLRLSQKV